MFNKIKYALLALAATTFLFAGCGKMVPQHESITLEAGERPMGIMCPKDMLCVYTLDSAMSMENESPVYKVHFYNSLNNGSTYTIFTNN